MPGINAIDKLDIFKTTTDLKKNPASAGFEKSMYGLLSLFMCAVTEWAVFALSASTEINGAVCFGGVRCRCKSTAFV